MVKPEKIHVKQHAMPVVLQNLPPAETLNQMIDNLNFLSLVMDEAFSSIQSEINAERAKIDSITSRVSRASKQTDLIAKYPNKATTVYSSSVFPSSVNKDNRQIDENLVNVIDPTDEIPRPKYKLSVEQRLERPMVTDTLKLFGRLSERTRYRPNSVVRGLGALPAKISSVSDCLLFNTDENPYVKYESLDNLQARMKSGEPGHAPTSDLDALQLVDAPKTIKEKNRLMDGDTYDIAYRPEMGDVPKFSFTATLGGLDNLALDIGWQGTKTSNQKIAPSSVAFQDLPELHVQPDMLPGFDELDDTPFGDFADFADGSNLPPPAPEISVTTAPPPPAAAAPPPTGAALAAPPPPVAPEIHVKPNDVGAEYRNGMQNAHPPAPMAPAAPPAPPAAARAPSPSPDDDDGGRGGLLAAIRAGKKLKNAKERKTAAKKAPAKPKTLSLMDHLKMKLDARKKVMSGDTDDTSSKKPSAPGLSLDMKDDDGRDDLGLGTHVPDTMRMAMQYDDDDDQSSGGSDWE